MTFDNIFKPLFQPLFQPVGGMLRRNFRTNSGTTDYVALASAVELAGDFDIECSLFCVDTTVSNQTIVSGTGFRFQITAVGDRPTISYLSTVTGTRTDLTFGGISFDHSKLNRISLYRRGNDITATVNSQSQTFTRNDMPDLTATRLFTNISGLGGADNLSGIISDLRITSAGVPIHFWPMNEGSGSTHVDVIGGNNGSIINGQPSDWELFERLPGANEWVGRELVTNGGFDADESWNKGTGASISGGVAIFSAAVGGISQVVPSLKAGGMFEFRVNILTLTAGSLRFMSGGAGYSGAIRTIAGAYVEKLTPTNGGLVSFGPVLQPLTGTIDNIGVRRILEIA